MCRGRVVRERGVERGRMDEARTAGGWRGKGSCIVRSVGAARTLKDVGEGGGGWIQYRFGLHSVVLIKVEGGDYS